VEIIDLKGTVFLPDFALRHPDGRTIYVEIVGFWHPDYLKRKLKKVRRAGLLNLILAVSERLKVGKGDLEGLPRPVVFFKGKLDPRKVLEVTESLGAG
jgi:predicted nuclease of restriction endonuclease-like RecB superfamily